VETEFYGFLTNLLNAPTMVGLGASAIYPYLLYATVLDECKKSEMGSYEIKTKLKNVNHALGQGLLKVMSKMGIATIASYRNSALFDVLGLGKDMVHECFMVLFL
jgi:glutamate synthase (NADPH/NADH) large chain